MATTAKILGIFLALAGVILWAASVLPPLPKLGIDGVPDEPLIASPLPATEDGYAVLVGTVVYDDDEDAPVSYIAYARPQGGMRTKQLVFRNRGCSPAAGDIPCAPGAVESPVIAEGTNVRVAGVVNGDQIFVESIQGIY